MSPLFATLKFRKVAWSDLLKNYGFIFDAILSICTRAPKHF